MKFLKSFLAIVLIASLCVAMPCATLAMTGDVPTQNAVTRRADGYGEKTGIAGTFYVYLSGGGSSGGITLRFQSSDQSVPIAIKVTAPNGRVVLWRDVDLPAAPLLYPKNGNEQKFTFSSPVAGNYTVTFTAISGSSIRTMCWIYSW